MIINFTLDPILVQVGPVAIGWQGLLTALGMALAVGVGVRNAGHRGISANTGCRLTIFALTGGVVFGRLGSVLAHALYYSANPAETITVWDGAMSLFGALLGGALAVWLGASRHGLSPWVTLDAAAPGALAGVAVGRVGCLLAGSAWGSPTGGAWGVVYWHPHDVLPPAMLSVPLHPYAAYEAGAALFLLACLSAARGKLARVEGSTFLVAALGYAVARLGLAGFRPEPGLPGGLQFVQLVGMAGGVALCWALVLRARAHAHAFERAAITRMRNHRGTSSDRHPARS